MSDERRETRKAAGLTVAACAVLVGLWTLVAGCTPDARAAPPAPDATAVLQQATDSTAVLTVSWGAVDPPADLWRWDVAEAGEAGEQTGRTLELEIDRRDSTYAETACVRGVAQRGDEEAVGEEGCASVSVPPTPLDAPGTPEVDAEVDTTTEVSQVPWDTLRPYDLETGTFASADTLAPGELGATLTVIGEIDGAQYVCATVEGRGQGWWELASTSGGLTLKSETTVFWDDRPDCGVEVDVSPSEPVRLVDASLDTLTEDADPSLVMDQTAEQRRDCVVQGVCR